MSEGKIDRVSQLLIRLIRDISAYTVDRVKELIERTDILEGHDDILAALKEVKGYPYIAPFQQVFGDMESEVRRQQEAMAKAAADEKAKQQAEQVTDEERIRALFAMVANISVFLPEEEIERIIGLANCIKNSKNRSDFDRAVEESEAIMARLSNLE